MVIYQTPQPAITTQNPQTTTVTTTAPLTREALLAKIDKSLVPHQHWDNESSAEAMLRLGMANILLRAGCPFERIVADWTFEDRHNTEWFQIMYNGKNKFAEDGPNAGEYDVFIFYIPAEARLAKLVRPDWTNQFFVD